MADIIWQRVKRQLDRYLVHKMTVYTRASSGGGYTVQNAASVTCLLQPLGQNSRGLTADERAQAALSGQLFFLSTYAMPEHAQIVVDAFGATRWQVVAGSVWPQNGPDGLNVMNTCEVRQVR